MKSFEEKSVADIYADGKLSEELCKEIDKLKDEELKTVIYYKTRRPEEVEEELKSNDLFRECYYTIIDILKKYCDLREDYYPIVSLWIIGTYIHPQFSTFPYLFFNAMKGSGKTRLLNLIATIAHQGQLLGSLKESVLFRTARETTFCIDEFEHISSKDNSALRELLNSGYKRGMKIRRMTKRKEEGKEDYVVEEFELYTPIAMANIYGMEEVLSDRCIVLTLEKSHNEIITRIVEDFVTNEHILSLKRTLGSVCTVALGIKNIPTLWNAFIINATTTTNTIHTTNTTNTTLFNKIKETSLNSRHLELFFPLFLLGNLCGQDILDKIIKIAEIIVKERKLEDVSESRDVSLIEFVSRQDNKDFMQLKHLLINFRQFYSDDEEESKWINSRWLGRALKRLVLIKEKRKVHGCREIILHIDKAKKKIKLFKDIEPEKPKEEIEVEKIG